MVADAKFLVIWIGGRRCCQQFSIVVVVCFVSGKISPSHEREDLIIRKPLASGGPHEREDLIIHKPLARTRARPCRGKAPAAAGREYLITRPAGTPMRSYILRTGY